MNATVAVAALGFMSTLVGTWLTARLQGRSAHAARILDAQVRVYGDCVASLNEYERATYNRVKARLASQSEPVRDELRQAAYRGNAQARSAIGQAALLSGKQSFHDKLEAVRQAIGDLNTVENKAELRQRHERIHADLARALSEARAQLMR